MDYSRPTPSKQRNFFPESSKPRRILFRRGFLLFQYFFGERAVLVYSTDFRDSTMLIFRSFRSITRLTSTENSMVSRKDQT